MSFGSFPSMSHVLTAPRCLPTFEVRTHFNFVHQKRTDASLEPTQTITTEVEIFSLFYIIAVVSETRSTDFGTSSPNPYLDFITITNALEAITSSGMWNPQLLASYSSEKTSATNVLAVVDYWWSETLSLLFSPFFLVRRHEIVACNIGLPLVSCNNLRDGQLNTNAEQYLPHTHFLNYLCDTPQCCLILGDLNAKQIYWSPMVSTAPVASFDVKLTSSLQDLIVFQHIREPTR